MQSASFWQSRTFWINVLAGLVATAIWLVGQRLLEPIYEAVAVNVWPVVGEWTHNLGWLAFLIFLALWLVNRPRPMHGDGSGPAVLLGSGRLSAANVSGDWEWLVRLAENEFQMISGGLVVTERNADFAHLGSPAPYLDLVFNVYNSFVWPVMPDRVDGFIKCGKHALPNKVELMPIPHGALTHNSSADVRLRLWLTSNVVEVLRGEVQRAGTPCSTLTLDFGELRLLFLVNPLGEHSRPRGNLVKLRLGVHAFNAGGIA